jgi:hypothetical protein
MSAIRDKNQKFTFVYSNLYQLYKKEAEEKQIPTGFERVSGQVIKTQDLHRPELAGDPLMSLKENLQALSKLHERLKFMLTELEDLVKE